uniref:Uncharacterized protein n=1 Tax=Arundo donax TaxID=35708 RepID=A0A0A9ATX5_ARUDO
MYMFVTHVACSHALTFRSSG